MSHIFGKLLIAVVIFCWLQCSSTTAQDNRPNIIHIFADDLGWGAVGFNNPMTHIDTPNMDQLALDGMILNRSYASTVCSPSRANLLTGFHNGHASNDRNGNLGAGVLPQEVTVGEVLSAAGYHTGIIGKWGWGASGSRDLNGPDPLPSIGNPGTLPSAQGYAEFYGYLSHGAAHDFYYDYMWESNGIAGTTITVPNNGGAGGAPEYSHDLIGRRSEAFIRDNAANGPFYLQVNYTIPHFDLDDIVAAPVLVNLNGDFIYPSGQAQYAGDGTLTDKMRSFSAMISRMDASIGSLIIRLTDPNLDGDPSDSVLDNTLIIFSSDNGNTPEDGLGAVVQNDPRLSGGLLGGKRDMYEGGIRMPSFAYWAGTIQPGSFTNLLNGLCDFQATAADLAGTRSRVGTDGVSILPTLLGGEQIKNRDLLLFENFENSSLGNNNSDWTIIRGDEKLIKFRDGSFELYDVGVDPGETTPLTNPTLQAELESLALAEGASQPDAYAVQYREWQGPDDGIVASSSNWFVTDDATNQNVGAINGTWSARVQNNGSTDATAIVDRNTSVLGIEVSGGAASQTLEVLPFVNLDGRNEIRVDAGGTLQLNQATATSRRWVEVLANGALKGEGVVSSNLYNSGAIALGFDGDFDPIDPPPTGDFGIVMDFSGIGNESAKDEVYTPLANNIAQAAVSFDYGPSTGSRLTDRGVADFENEFNLSNWQTGNSLASAIVVNAFVNLTVQPVSGLSAELLSVEFEAWRNGTNAPRDYAILTNIDGFVSGSELGTQTVTNSGQNNTFTVSANGTSGLSTAGAIEVRLFGWNAGNTFGNTHLTGAELDVRFTTAPGVTFNPAGSVEVAGDFVHREGGRVEIGFSGTDNSDPAALQFDVLNVLGDVQLEGDLILNLLDNYQIQAGDEFTFLTGASVSGTFTNVILNNATGFSPIVDYTATTVSVRFEPTSPVIVPASNFNVFRGVLVNGGLAEVQASDDSDLRVNPGFVINPTEAPVWLTFDASLANASPNTLSIRVESSANTPGIEQAVELFDWNTNQYVELERITTAFNTDSIQIVDLTPFIADFVQDVSAEVSSRIGYRAVGFTILFPWTINTDEVAWLVQ